jgi:hypothetical protein
MRWRWRVRKKGTPSLPLHQTSSKPPQNKISKARLTTKSSKKICSRPINTQQRQPTTETTNNRDNQQQRQPTTETTNNAIVVYIPGQVATISVSV